MSHTLLNCLSVQELQIPFPSCNYLVIFIPVYDLDPYGYFWNLMDISDFMDGYL